ncbi:MAG: precorrin-2 C(20)-methyltransferase, partial [Candidatus Bathyarchaeota archaeon]|nr:precorrin-2 C(20)-methyltransferase [Candidatus Bathyarchaeota archaeon]
KKVVGKFVGVGVGPGDPELITVKAAKVLKTADVISIPKAHENKPSLALSIVNDVLKERKNAPEVLELVFPMTNDKDELERLWCENAHIVAGEAKKGKTIAFITLGDPMFYSTFIYLCKKMQQEHPEVELQIIPGVTSLTACAAVSKIPLAEKNEVVAVLTSGVAEEKISEIAKHASSLVFMKGAKQLKSLVPVLEKSGFTKNSTVTIVRRCTLPQQDVMVGKLGDVQGWDIHDDYFSISMIKQENKENLK